MTTVRSKWSVEVTEIFSVIRIAAMIAAMPPGFLVTKSPNFPRGGSGSAHHIFVSGRESRKVGSRRGWTLKRMLQ